MTFEQMREILGNYEIPEIGRLNFEKRKEIFVIVVHFKNYSGESFCMLYAFSKEIKIPENLQKGFYWSDYCDESVDTNLLDEFVDETEALLFTWRENIPT